EDLPGSGRGLTTTDRMHHLNAVAVAQYKLFMLAAGDYVFVNLRGQSLTHQGHFFHECRHCRPFVEFHGLTIHLNLHSVPNLGYYTDRRIPAINNNTQPTIKHTPPIGVTGPTQRMSVSTSVYRLPLNRS